MGDVPVGHGNEPELRGLPVCYNSISVSSPFTLLMSCTVSHLVGAGGARSALLGVRAADNSKSDN